MLGGPPKRALWPTGWETLIYYDLTLICYKRSLDLLISNKYDPAFEWVDIDADVIRLDNVQISAWRFELHLSQVRPQLDVLVAKKNRGRPQVCARVNNCIGFVNADQQRIRDLEEVLRGRRQIDEVDLASFNSFFHLDHISLWTKFSTRTAMV